MKKLDHDLRHDPALVEHIKQYLKSNMIRVLVHLQMSEYTTKEKSMMAQLRPQFEAQTDYCRRGDMYDCDEEPVMRCSNCKVVKYCSAECQAVHWSKGHRFRCFEPNFDVLNDV